MTRGGECAAPATDVRARRLAFLGLVLATMAALAAWLVQIFSPKGLSAAELVLVALFVLNTPWLSIGLWNAVIGVIVMHARPDWLRLVLPLNGLADDGTVAPVPVAGRTAIVVPVRNEDPDEVLARLGAVARSLEGTGCAAAFELFLLSDTSRADIAAAEERLVAAWREEGRFRLRLRYRRRPVNHGHKAGNIREFCQRYGDGFRYMVLLDADSLMTGAAIVRLVRVMQLNPQLGILQTLVTGLPSQSPFSRIFQFGMRHGMRSYTAGSAWWQGDQGPYWGHNAIVRLAPFRAACGLPRLSGSGPLGGDILSHDQVEAVLMRRAGYEVRVLPIEDGSFEENPPTLQEFIRRDLRWCQGNMQYLRLLGLPGIRLLGRLQLVLAILMYTAAPVWYCFMTVGIADSALTRAEGGSLQLQGDLVIALFVTVLLMNFAPRILGVIDVLLRPRERERYGGTAALVRGACIELLFSVLVTPAVALAQAIFIAGLFAGRCITWEAQERGQREISPGEAASALWPQLLAGVCLALALAVAAPDYLLWGMPVIAGLLLAIPVAIVTSGRRLGRFLAHAGWCAIPEEIDPPVTVEWAGFDSARSGGPDRFAPAGRGEHGAEQSERA